MGEYDRRNAAAALGIDAGRPANAAERVAKNEELFRALAGLLTDNGWKTKVGNTLGFFSVAVEREGNTWTLLQDAQGQIGIWAAGNNPVAPAPVQRLQYNPHEGIVTAPDGEDGLIVLAKAFSALLKAAKR